MVEKVRNRTFETPFMPNENESHFEAGLDMAEAFEEGHQDTGLETTVGIAEAEQKLFIGYEQNVPIKQKETSVMSSKSREERITSTQRREKRRSSLVMMGHL